MPPAPVALVASAAATIRPCAGPRPRPRAGLLAIFHAPAAAASRPPGRRADVAAGLLALWLLAGGAARAAGDAEAGIDAALDLADDTPASASAPASATAKPWTVTLEASGIDERRRDGSRAPDSRLAADLRIDAALATGWRGVLAHRIDVDDPTAARRHTVAMLKEAYLGWQPTPWAIVEVGRINLRMGSAYGWNPTDVFKTEAVRSVASADPDSLRRQRLGSAMLRGQWLWTGGSASAVYSPRLAARREESSLPTMSFSGRTLADDSLARTNGSNRWLLSASQAFGERARGVLSLSGGDEADTRLGLDLSGLVGRATTAHLEWSGARERTLYERSTGADSGTRRWRSRAALGLTHTFPIDLSLTFEGYLNESAPSRPGWQALLFSPSLLGHVLLWSAAQQELPSRQGLFLHATWRNVLRPRLDLSGFVQADTDAGGRQYWFEARRRFDAYDLALRWQRQTGPEWTRYGLVPEARTLQLLAAFYF